MIVCLYSKCKEIYQWLLQFIGSDGGRGGHARVKWGHDMNDDDFEEVAVKPSHNIQHHPEVGRSQSGGARYNDNKHSNR